MRLPTSSLSKMFSRDDKKRTGSASKETSKNGEGVNFELTEVNNKTLRLVAPSYPLDVEILLFVWTCTIRLMQYTMRPIWARVLCCILIRTLLES